MSARSWVGIGMALIVFALAGLYIHAGHEFNATSGLTFGGGLLFAGMLIDPVELKAILVAIVPFGKHGE